jgi:prepilin-type N-terminal cleavage/methylation domain-containing protein
VRKVEERGFTLIELLVVVAIIGILAAMAIINYRIGLERAKQKRTMSDMRTMAMAWEARASDTKGYNAAGFTMPASIITTDQTSGLLVPTYTKTIPRADGWGRPFEFSMDQAIGAGAATIYAIRSAGGDGVYESDTYTQGTTQKFDCDIVYSNGTFISYPAAN